MKIEHHHVGYYTKHETNHHSTSDVEPHSQKQGTGAQEGQTLVDKVFIYEI